MAPAAKWQAAESRVFERFQAWLVNYLSEGDFRCSEILAAVISQINGTRSLLGGQGAVKLFRGF